MKRFLTDILIPLLAIVLMVISISSLAAIEFPDYTSEPSFSSERSFSNEGTSDEKNIVDRFEVDILRFKRIKGLDQQASTVPQALSQ